MHTVNSLIRGIEEGYYIPKASDADLWLRSLATQTVISTKETSKIQHLVKALINNKIESSYIYMWAAVLEHSEDRDKCIEYIEKAYSLRVEGAKNTNVIDSVLSDLREKLNLIGNRY